VALAQHARRRLPISAPTGVGVFAMGRRAHRTHLAGLFVLLAACGGRGGEAHARPARRIVSLSPAVTELLFAIGAGDRLVGRTTWCDYPPAARQVPSVTLRLISSAFSRLTKGAKLADGL
jgi:ABC-type hemin transport system substrate-binding protein